ncbi:MAG: DUF6531 domain-containing protein [Solirubrobacteraceae bacterium MAG38_C4-C5]|nr:DUF6531 domain-containing protein [Candidatus Siliceabacter maunaloa]
MEFPQSGVPGVALPEQGFGLELAEGQQRLAQLSEDRVFYASTLTDTDVFAGATATGAEVALQLRSPASPERFVFDVELPEGAVVRRATTEEPIPGDPPQSLEVARGDEVLGYVRPPQAHDVDGRSLAVAMRAEGDRIVLEVPHRDGDIRYPALVDPEVVHVANRWAGYQGWNWSQELAGAAPAYNTNFGVALGDCAYGCHYYTSMPTRHWFNHGAYAHFWLRSPVGTFIARSENHNIGHKPYYYNGATYSSAFQGIMNPWYSGWEHVWSGRHEYWGVRHDYGGHGEQNFALFGIQAYNPGGGVWTGEQKAWASMETNVVLLGDRHAPAAWGNAVNHAWHDDDNREHVFSARARDHGLGVRGISFTGPPSGAGTATTTCSGDPYRSACPRDQDWGRDYRYRLNEGTTNFELYSWDVVGNQSQRHRWSQRIDRTPPRVRMDSPTGSLHTKHLHEDTYTVTASADDGRADGVETSCVTGLVFKIDGIERARQAAPAAADCTMRHDFQLRPYDLAAGVHRVAIEAIDGAGNVARSSEWTVRVASGTVVTPKEGFKTPRRVTLVARGKRAGLSSVGWQFRRAATDAWSDVPVEHLRTDDGEVVTDRERQLVEGQSAAVSWDVLSTPQIASKDGPVQVRGVFSGGPGGETQAVKFELDQKGLETKTHREEIGPGNVNLLTGNFSLAEEDVSIQSPLAALGVARTYNSRDAGGNADGAFGPGWTSSLPTGVSEDYARLAEKPGTDFLALVLADGTEAAFSRGGSGYTPEFGFEHLTLTKPAENTYEVKDLDGVKTTFARSSADPVAFLPTRVEHPGDQSALSFATETVDGKTRVVRALAPSPPGINCAAGVVKGCRALHLVYADTTTATGPTPETWGDFKGRLVRVDLEAFDPASGAMSRNAVARYAYDATGRLRAQWDPRIGARAQDDLRLRRAGPAHPHHATRRGTMGPVLCQPAR